MEEKNLYVKIKNPLFIPLSFLFGWIWLISFFIFFVGIDLKYRSNLIFLGVVILFILLGLIYFPNRFEMDTEKITIEPLPFLKFSIPMDNVKRITLRPKKNTNFINFFYFIFIVVRRPFPFVFILFHMGTNNDREKENEEKILRLIKKVAKYE